MYKIVPGINVLLQQNLLADKRIGFVTNNAALTAEGTLSRVALLTQGCKLIKLFSPEHGISRSGADGAPQRNHTDSETSLPVISLYGEKRMPAAADVKDIDVLLFDIPDVGCRFYTYLWTLTYIMEAAAAFNKPLIITDRPNPTGIQLSDAEGPWLDEKHCSSFIGRWNMPLRHCCTLAELALYFNKEKNIDADITIIKAANYQRNTNTYSNVHFTPTSPAIKNIETAMLYPGTGLLEGIMVNEGRGTNTPFTVFGAPFIQQQQLLQQWQQLQLPGISAAAVTYTPQNGLYQNMVCNGLKFTVNEAAYLRPVAAGIALLQLLLHIYPEVIQDRLYATAANPTGAGHLDKLLGIPNAFEALKKGLPINTSISNQWRQIISPYLLY